jgi:hypothetical protein
MAGVASKVTLATLAVEFLSESLARRAQIIDTAGIVGSRTHPSERSRAGPEQIGGSVTLVPTAAVLTTMLPYILGTSGALTETIADFTTEKTVETKKFSYGNCKVARATFSASRGGALQLSLDIQAKSETVTTASIAATVALAAPYVFTDLTLTVASVAYSANSFQLTIDNGIEVENFNSLTPVRLNETDRVISWSMSVPFLDATALYPLATAGVSAVAAFGNGSTTLTFTSPKLQVPPESPTVGGRGETLFNVNGVARGSAGAGTELTIAQV